MAADNSLGPALLVLVYMLWSLAVGLLRKRPPANDLQSAKAKTNKKRSKALWVIVFIGLALIVLGMTATAVCSDGSLSWSSHRSGTCSWHGGVSSWR